MSLSPKSVFFSIVAFGLPIAVTTGWTLGDRPAAIAPAPAGDGSIGTAPSNGVASWARRAGQPAPAARTAGSATPPSASAVPSATTPTGPSPAPADTGPPTGGPTSPAVPNPPVPTPASPPPIEATPPPTTPTGSALPEPVGSPERLVRTGAAAPRR